MLIIFIFVFQLSIVSTQGGVSGSGSGHPYDFRYRQGGDYGASGRETRGLSGRDRFGSDRSMDSLVLGVQILWSSKVLWG